MMKKILVTILALVASGVFLGAQDNPEDVVAKLQTNRVTVDYSFKYDKVSCSGTITVQVPCYKAVGNGIEVWSDGVCRWTVDREAREVYIEAAESPEDYLNYLQGITDLSLKSVKCVPISEDISPFRFDVAALDKDWVVTDLR